jgi:quercetin dioxygenase-like cupin family protein
MHVKANIWNSKALKYSEELSFEDIIIQRRDAVIVKFNEPVNEGVQPTWSYKNLLTKDVGSDIYVAWIRMEPGGGHDYHAHSGDEIVFMLSGKAQFTYRSVDEKDVRTILETGDLAYFPAGTPHSVWNIFKETCTFLVIKHPPFFLEELPLPEEIRKIKLYPGSK